MKCGHCATAGACVGGRLCQLTDPNHRDYDARYVAMLAGTKMTEGDGASAPASQVRVAIDPYAVAIESCDFRVSTCNCLTKPALCYLASQPVTVTLDICRRCIAANP